MKKSFGSLTLLYPLPVWCIGTYDNNGEANIMTASWGGICCSDPPCVTISLRKATYTYGNLVERRAFSVNIPSAIHVKEADYFGIESGRDVDKFSKTNLTPIKSDLVDAPYVDEFPLVLECQLLHTHEIGSHTQFIGKIEDVKIEESMLDNKGGPDIKKIKPFILSLERRVYFGIGSELDNAWSAGKSFRDT